MSKIDDDIEKFQTQVDGLDDAELNIMLQVVLRSIWTRSAIKFAPKKRINKPLLRIVKDEK